MPLFRIQLKSRNIDHCDGYKMENVGRLQNVQTFGVLTRRFPNKGERQKIKLVENNFSAALFFITRSFDFLWLVEQLP
jgi:hypothetical protein